MFAVFVQPETPPQGAWFHVVSTDEGDKVVGILKDCPNLEGFTRTRPGQVAEECTFDFGDAECHAAYFRQKAGANVGCGDMWVYMAYTILN